MVGHILEIKSFSGFVKYLWGYFFKEYPNYAFSLTRKIHTTALTLGQHNFPIVHCRVELIRGTEYSQLKFALHEIILNANYVDTEKLRLCNCAPIEVMQNIYFKSVEYSQCKALS